ncbi:MAG: hypothetical protein RLZZ387_4335 [Chloroflexota bacterium]|jgi:signal transduction histidine kinase
MELSDIQVSDDQIRMLEAARRNEERFRVAQELSLDAFTVLAALRDEAGTIVDFVWEYANPAAGRILKIPHESLIGRRLLELLPDNRETLFPRYVQVVLTGQPHDIELHYRGGGIEGWFRNMAVQLNDGVAVSFSDITARKRTETALEVLAVTAAVLTSSLDQKTMMSQAVRLIVPTLADWSAVNVLDDDGHIRLVALAHVDAHESERLTALSHDIPLDPDATMGVARVLRTGETEFYPDAEHAPEMAHLNSRSYLCVPLIARDRHIGALTLGTRRGGRRYDSEDVVIAEALGRRIALALDNARLYEAAQQAVRLRDMFFSVAAHELRTPITSLLGQAQLLERRAAREGHLNERDQYSVSVIGAQAQRLSRMVNALLDIARLDQGRLSLDLAPLDVGQLVRRVVEEAQPTLDRHSVSCQVCDEPLELLGDALRLEQVLQNLLSNAVKYSPAGGVIRITAARRGRAAVIEVEDTGIGIPAAALPQLFQRFFRAPNAEALVISGMGIGLYVVKEIVTLHGGTIHVSSAEGQGTTFTIRLPLSGRAT